MMVEWLSFAPSANGCRVVRRWCDVAQLDHVGIARAISTSTILPECLLVGRGYHEVSVATGIALTPSPSTAMERFDRSVAALHHARSALLEVTECLRSAGLDFPDIDFDAAEVLRLLGDDRQSGRLQSRVAPLVGVPPKMYSEFAKRLGLDSRR